MTEDPKTLSVDQAAARLGCSRRTIYNALADGRLSATRTALGSQRVLVASIEALRPGMVRAMPRRGTTRSAKDVVIAAHSRNATWFRSRAEALA